MRNVLTAPSPLLSELILRGGLASSVLPLPLLIANITPAGDDSTATMFWKSLNQNASPATGGASGLLKGGLTMSTQTSNSLKLPPRYGMKPLLPASILNSAAPPAILNQGAFAHGPSELLKSSEKISSPLQAKAGLAATVSANMAAATVRSFISNSPCVKSWRQILATRRIDITAPESSRFRLLLNRRPQLRAEIRLADNTSRWHRNGQRAEARSAHHRGGRIRGRRSLCQIKACLHCCCGNASSRHAGIRGQVCVGSRCGDRGTRHGTHLTTRRHHGRRGHHGQRAETVFL